MSDDVKNRRQDRRRNVRIASILTSDGRSPISCVVLDLSASGARLHIHNQDEVPDTFRLLLVATDEQHGCTVVWRAGEEMGVRFTS